MISSGSNISTTRLSESADGDISMPITKCVHEKLWTFFKHCIRSPVLWDRVTKLRDEMDTSAEGLDRQNACQAFAVANGMCKFVKVMIWCQCSGKWREPFYIC